MTPADDDSAAHQALERAREMAKNPLVRRRRRDKRPEVPVAEAGPGLGNPGSGAKPSRRDPALLGDLSAALLEARGWGEAVEAAAVVGRWREIVGDDIADHTTVEALDDGVLTIRASSTPWAANLRLLMGDLRRRIADVAGADAVREVRVLGPAAPSWSHGHRTVRGRGPRDTYG